ncbi:MAG: glutamate synthase subunit alpha, partial [Planctomycetes bacterium]|nr:glutamate synthase subunit alpha [Planctomycetota bacterium]
MGIIPTKQGLYDPANEHDNCGVAFIASIKGVKSHGIVRDGLSMMCNLKHRGAVGADPDTGDGAGLLIQIPDEFLRKNCGFELPEPGLYAVANVFFPTDEQTQTKLIKLFERGLADCGLQFIGWRKLDVNNSNLGAGALGSEPLVLQAFVGRGTVSPENLNLVLFRARKRIERLVLSVGENESVDDFYICSLSTSTLVYKGMFQAQQLRDYYLDLKDPSLESAIALVHQRFSTNTFPSWKLAHPFRYIAHNGEINTLQGNINMMRSREPHLADPRLDKDAIKDLLPLVLEGQSDSASFDNALELLLHTGRSLPHALTMLIPEAWSSRKHMDAKLKSFFQYHANLMEPWDGPAAIAATDGKLICAVLDRNGLRPARFCVTKDDRIVFASEVGTLPLAEENIAYRSRLWPGKLIVVDTEKGLLIEDDEVKEELVNHRPYRQWLEDGLISLEDLPDPIIPPKPLLSDLNVFQRGFGYSEEQLKTHVAPMATEGAEPVGSMGNDAPLAVLSK